MSLSLWKGIPAAENPELAPGNRIQHSTTDRLRLQDEANPVWRRELLVPLPGCHLCPWALPSHLSLPSPIPAPELPPLQSLQAFRLCWWAAWCCGLTCWRGSARGSTRPQQQGWAVCRSTEEVGGLGIAASSRPWASHLSPWVSAFLPGRRVIKSVRAIRQNE